MRRNMNSFTRPVYWRREEGWRRPLVLASSGKSIHSPTLVASESSADDKGAAGAEGSEAGAGADGGPGGRATTQGGSSPARRVELASSARQAAPSRRDVRVRNRSARLFLNCELFVGGEAAGRTDPTSRWATRLMPNCEQTTCQQDVGPRPATLARRRLGFQ